MPYYLLITLAIVFDIALALFHALFWKLPLFHWKRDLRRISSVNRGLLQILNICLIYVFIGIAALVYRSFDQGMQFSDQITMFGIAAFWFMRMILQLLYFPLRNCLSIFFGLLFFTGFWLHFLPALFVLLVDVSERG